MIIFLAFPSSTKHKLVALAKDELLASLNVPLFAGDVNQTVVEEEEEVKQEDHVTPEKEQVDAEKQRKESMFFTS